MSRLVPLTPATLLIVLLAIAGCHALGPAPSSAPPEGLESRLAAIERDRAAAAAASARFATASSGHRLHSSSPVPQRVDKVAVARGIAGDRGGVAADLDGVAAAQETAASGWTLAELGDGPPPEGESNLFALEPGTAADREARYLRRAPLDSLWGTIKRDVKALPGDLWRDTKHVYGNPVNLVILGTAYGGSLAIQETGPDDTVEDHYRPGRHTFSRGWRNTADAVGNPGTHFALAGAWYLLGQQLQDEKTYDVSRTLASALILNGLTTMVGQAASWDRAPNGEWGTFPSGHTSSSFCFASVMHRAYGHAVGVPLYGLATLVAWERVDDRNHYFSDVVMGAVLGTVIGHSVASGRDPEFYGWKILPYADPAGASGVAFLKTMP